MPTRVFFLNLICAILVGLLLTLGLYSLKVDFSIIFSAYL